MDNKPAGVRQRAEDFAAAWIARRECTGWSQADEAELRIWIDEDINHRAAWLRLDSAWQQTSRLKGLATTNGPAAVPAREDIRLPYFDSDLKPDIVLPSQKHTIRSLLLRSRALAVCTILAVLGGVFIYLHSQSTRYHTEVGAMQAVPLSDGSRVTLNTDTDIRVAVTRTERRIDLQRGEAYFEVAKDPSRPFVVAVGRNRITAVGTQFSVRRNGDDVRIVVTEGTVRVEGGAAQTIRPSMLHAGSIARATAKAVRIEQKPITEAEQVLSWRSGYLIFDQTPLGQAAAEFNRYNVRQILIEDPAVARIPVGGNFRAANLDAFVRLMQIDLPIISVERGNRVLLKARPFTGQ